MAKEKPATRKLESSRRSGERGRTEIQVYLKSTRCLGCAMGKFKGIVRQDPDWERRVVGSEKGKGLREGGKRMQEVQGTGSSFGSSSRTSTGATSATGCPLSHPCSP